MVSKSQIKLITSLAQKKSRTKTGLFLVEGKKGIKELLNSHFVLNALFTTDDIFNTPVSKTFLISTLELRKLSRLTTPQTAVASFEIPDVKTPEYDGLVVALDGIRDPGNLGTIIRLCDWFGVRDLICSDDCVDCYNPKVVQASMGSIARVNIIYKELEQLLMQRPPLPVLGAFLEGKNIYRTSLPLKGILVLGNEANGISREVEKLVSQKISIPQFGTSTNTESLNVATATAVLLSEFRRQHFIEK